MNNKYVTEEQKDGADMQRPGNITPFALEKGKE